MKTILKKLENFILNNTPACDKLGHDFWGNHLWSNIGVLSALLIAWVIPTLWLLIIPIGTTVIPAFTKEKKDGEDNNGDGKLDGNRDPKDFWWTLASLPMKLLLLGIIIFLMLKK